MKLAQMSAEELTKLLASDAPAPGGGSAAALEGALGAALTAMVCGLTAEKPQYAAYRAEILAVQARAETLREQFLTLMDRDTEAFLQVSNAFAMPKATDEEKVQRSAAIQQGLTACTETPLAVMTLAAEGLELIQSLLGRYNESAASDLGVAAVSLEACARGAWLNVLINVGSLKDREKAHAFREQGKALLEQARNLAAYVEREQATCWDME